MTKQLQVLSVAAFATLTTLLTAQADEPIPLEAPETPLFETGESAVVIKLRESDWADYIAEHVLNGAQTEVLLPDRTRIDILTKTHAWEVDYAHKQYEAIGQSLFYALSSDRNAGIMLLFDHTSVVHQKHYLRAKLVCQKTGISLFVINMSEYEDKVREWRSLRM